MQKNDRMAALDLSEINARVQQAKSANEKTQRDLERAERLYNDKVVTLEQLQNAETARDMAQSELKIAEFNLRHAVIYAPEDGYVLKHFSEEGELLAPGQPVILFGSRESGWILQAGLTDRQVVRVEAGDSAHVYFDAFADFAFKARVSQIEAAANPLTGTYEVELDVDPSGRTLFSGFIGKIRLFPGKKQKIYVVPIEALTEADQNQGFVFTPGSDKRSVRKIAVIIERIWNDQVLVSRGLENISEVITSGAQYLDEQSTIEITH